MIKAGIPIIWNPRDGLPNPALPGRTRLRQSDHAPGILARAFRAPFLDGDSIDSLFNPAKVAADPRDGQSSCPRPEGRFPTRWDRYLVLLTCRGVPGTMSLGVSPRDEAFL
jgi:hypothetical protein